ncbi:MAG: peptidoglycan DD-metalloendopeptidase family protein [Pseudomonadota bacterium]
MSSVCDRKRRAALMTRVASMAILSGLAAGCSTDVSRFSDGVFAGSTPNQQAILRPNDGAAAPSSEPSYTGSVSRRSGSHIPSVNDVPLRHQTESTPALPPLASESSVVPVKQSTLAPLRESPAKVSANNAGAGWSSHNRTADPEPDRIAALSADSAAAASRPSAPAPVPTGDARVAALPPARPSQVAADPIVTGSLPPAGTSEPAQRRGGGWSRTGGSIVTAGTGDTGNTLARRYGVPVSAILVANNMSDPNSIQPGQRVVIPTYVYSANNPAQSADKGLPQGRDAFALLQNAPVPKGKPRLTGRVAPQASIGSSSTKLSDGHYVVRPGDSVASIASKFNTSPTDLRAVNALNPEALLWIGQKLRIPSTSGATRVAGLTTAVTGAASDTPAATSAPVAASTPVSSVATPSPKPRRRGSARAEKPASAPIRAPERQVARRSDPAATANDAGPQTAQPAERKVLAAQFAWPAKGPVISRFGRKANGERNDGINIQVPKGAPVTAAGKGVVIYAGNELKGYGNLVLVRHADGWVSAYAHNSELSVRRGDAVSKGQVIALAGETGSVSEPQVHFELRRNSKPVDPMPLLASR